MNIGYLGTKVLYRVSYPFPARVTVNARSSLGAHQGTSKAIFVDVGAAVPVGSFSCGKTTLVG